MSLFCQTHPWGVDGAGLATRGEIILKPGHDSEAAAGSVKLLQYSHLEMVEHVQEAILENHTLEVVPDSEGSHISEGEQRLHDNAAKEEREESEQRSSETRDIDWEKFLADNAQSGESRGPSMAGGSDDMPPIETNLTYGQSLADHLIWQLTMLKCGETEESFCRVIIHNLDDRGFLPVDLRELAQLEGVDEEQAAESLETITKPSILSAVVREICAMFVDPELRARFPEDPNFPLFFTEENLRHLERRNYSALSESEHPHGGCHRVSQDDARF